MRPTPGQSPGSGTAGHGSSSRWVRAQPFGDRAYLLEPAGAPGGEPPGEDPGTEATAWVLAAVRTAQERWPGATVVAGLASVLVAFESPGDLPDQASVAHGWPRPDRGAAPGGEQRVVRIPVRYDGPDLGDVARGLGLAPAELVARHRAAQWTVAALGFSPGFGYLSSPDPLFRAIRRRADPRRRVPPGSLAIAAGMSAVYPSSTPGGWNLIGTTDAVLFDADRTPPALLRVGDLVVFQELP